MASSLRWDASEKGSPVLASFLFSAPARLAYPSESLCLDLFLRRHIRRSFRDVRIFQDERRILLSLMSFPPNLSQGFGSSLPSLYLGGYVPSPLNASVAPQALPSFLEFCFGESSLLQDDQSIFSSFLHLLPLLVILAGILARSRFFSSPPLKSPYKAEYSGSPTPPRYHCRAEKPVFFLWFTGCG